MAYTRSYGVLSSRVASLRIGTVKSGTGFSCLAGDTGRPPCVVEESAALHLRAREIAADHHAFDLSRNLLGHLAAFVGAHVGFEDRGGGFYGDAGQFLVRDT
jgi:hypothetical protein